uniref:Uncharacterized protein n=1 Tax=Rhizophora mucronata TaxID=61149 RepID=A0A2P2R396_RHIMU
MSNINILSILYWLLMNWFPPCFFMILSAT